MRQTSSVLLEERYILCVYLISKCLLDGDDGADCESPYGPYKDKLKKGTKLPSLKKRKQPVDFEVSKPQLL
jgi:hypothetical protein